MPGGPTGPTHIRGLRLSRDSSHLVVLTDNDKAVVVLGQDFEQIKRQSFPKRPCAVTTSLDDTQVVVADKFGDVYAIGMEDEPVEEAALHPLLGHVSMLTCVDLAPDAQGRACLFSADRDEHIRVSYFPKSYVIKKFLFGHEEFVSKFVFPSWCGGKVVVSGGGDTFLLSWNWQYESSEPKSRLDVLEIVEKYLDDSHLAPKKFQNKDDTLKEFCVVDIIPLENCHKVAVLFEAVAAIFLFDVSETGELAYFSTVETQGKVVCGSANKDTLFVSVDSAENPVEIFAVAENGQLEKAHQDLAALMAHNIPENPQKTPLFTTGQLRKRREH